MRWNVCMGHWAHAALHNFQTPDALHCLVKGERTGKCKELISYQNLHLYLQPITLTAQFVRKGLRTSAQSLHFFSGFRCHHQHHLPLETWHPCAESLISIVCWESQNPTGEP